MPRPGGGFGNPETLDERQLKTDLESISMLQGYRDMVEGIGENGLLDLPGTFRVNYCVP